MDTIPCLSIEELATLERAEAADPRRAHVASCARCGALALELAEFMAANADEAGVPASDVRSAEQRLEGFLAAELASPRPSAQAPHQESWPRRFAAWIASPPARPALAFAAVVLVASVFLATRRPPLPGDAPPTLRSDVPTARLSVELLTPPIAVNGRATMEWRPVAGAEGYRVEVYSEELDPLGTYGPFVAAEFVFGPELVPALPRGAHVLVKIVALKDAQKIAESELAPLQVP